MASKKYLELDSNFRNRFFDPNPGAFEVNIAQYGKKTQTQALDPVTLAYPSIVWIGQNLVTNTFTLASSSGVGSQSSLDTFIIQCTFATLQEVIDLDGYGNGAIMEATRAATTRRRIIDWKFLSSDKALVPTEINITCFYQVTVDSAWPSDFFSASSLSIKETFDIANQPGEIFVPSSKGISNFYNSPKYILFNQTANQYTNITSFDGLTHVALFTTNAQTASWNSNDTYILRSDPPRIFNDVTTTVVPPGVTSLPPNSIILTSTTPDLSFINAFIRLISNTFDRLSSIMKIVQLFGYYTLPDSTKVYTSDTNLIQVYLPIVIVDKFVAPPENPASTTWPYEILQFSYDNVNPFQYNGSLVSQGQSVSYDVTLNSLTLPNVPLANGGRIACYPFIYVVIENVSSSTSASNMIYTNNPATGRAVFKVPISDLNHPLSSPFVRLTGNGMNQTMIFKPNDNMKVSVLLPNGEVFKTFQNDNLYGEAPNPLLQVTFCFGMQKI